MYSPSVLDHFMHPRHVGVLENADAYARAESTVHDDLVDVYLKIDDDRITDIRYQVHGCAAAIASTSIASELVLGKTLDEAEALTTEDISEALGGLPESKIECSVLAPQALRKAIDAYRQSH